MNPTQNAIQIDHFLVDANSFTTKYLLTRKHTHTHTIASALLHMDTHSRTTLNDGVCNVAELTRKCTNQMIKTSKL